MTEPAAGTSPPSMRRKVCPSCGREFDCGLRGCWCARVVVEAAALAAIREEFSDCLCPTCLVGRGSAR